LALGVALVTGLAGSAQALWSDQAELTGQLNQGLVGFAVTRQDQATAVAVEDKAVAEQESDALTLTLNQDDLETLAHSGQLAIGFDVWLRADGAAGLDYSIAVPSLSTDTITSTFTGLIMGPAQVNIFPVDSPASCTLDQRPTDPVGLSGIEGLPATYAPVKTAVQSWCLTATRSTGGDPSGNQSVYSTTVSARGTDTYGFPASSEQTDDSKWWVNLIDGDIPWGPAWQLTVTHQLTP
jgi:hypothetical protein